MIEVLNPVQEPKITYFDGAARITTLNGKTLGLWSNSKLNAARMVEFIGEELAKDFAFQVVRGSYDAADIMPPDAWGEVARCDAVVLANGDCGACSTSGIANAIELEKRGIPTLLVSTPPFVDAVKTFAHLRGMPDIKWAVVNHPIGSLEAPQVRERAQLAARQFVDLIIKAA